jgi:hypothetical protein
VNGGEKKEKIETKKEGQEKELETVFPFSCFKLLYMAGLAKTFTN